MLMEGLVGITALIAARALPPERLLRHQHRTRRSPSSPGDASTARASRARAAELAALDAVLTAHDRELLGLAPGERRRRSRARSVKRQRALAPLEHARSPRSATTSIANEPTRDRARRRRFPAPRHHGQRASHPRAREPTRSSPRAPAARVSLAVGMARVFCGLPGMKTLHRVLVPLRDHVRGALRPHHHRHRHAHRALPAAGVRGPRLRPPFGEADVAARARSSRRRMIVAGWSYFILTGIISTIWPMFGIANQLLAATALAVGNHRSHARGPKPTLRADHAGAAALRGHDHHHRRHSGDPAMYLPCSPRPTRTPGLRQLPR